MLRDGVLVVAGAYMAFVVMLAIAMMPEAEASQPLFDKPHSHRSTKDAIVACLQKEGMPVYAVGPEGPPPIGKPVTAEMFTVVCVREVEP